MAKDKLTQYDSVASNNLDVGGISIAEGMLPSNVNNAMREQMSHLADFVAGTSGVDVLKFQDDTDTNSIKIQAPASVTTTTTLTLPDGDGSANQSLTTNGSGTLSWSTRIGNVVEDTTPQLGGNLDTNGNDITFGDNDKAIFGAGSDLQIYHTGSASIIRDQGDGSLYIDGSNEIFLRGQSGFTNMIKAIDGAEVQLYHNNNLKLATTSGGVDVTGTVTADGLTVQDASAGRVLTGIFQNTTNSAGTSSGISLRNSADTTSVNLTAERVGGNAGADLVITGFDNAGVEKNFMRITEGNDISFYDSTGVTQGFFWDASTQRLGLGTTSPSHELTVSAANDSGVRIDAEGNNVALMLTDATTSNGFRFNYNAPNDVLTLDTTNGTGAKVAELMRIQSDGNVGIGTTSPSHPLTVNGQIKSTGTNGETVQLQTSSQYTGVSFVGSDGVRDAIIDYDHTGGVMGLKAHTSGHYITFATGGYSERMRIDSSGNLLVGRTSALGFGSGSGLVVLPTQGITFSKTTSTDLGAVAYFNRNNGDGNLIEFAEGATVEGSVSVSGTTVSYNGGHLSRWSRLTDDSKDTSIVKGTVMTNLDAMVEWGDEDNEQLNKMAVSSVEGDANVAGVFVNWDISDDWNDMNVAMTGDMVIRIAQGTTVARGDLLMSAGDGTAKPQGDDIVRSKTIAKVTSTHVSHTYDDGSYLVPCVLMAC